MSSAFVPGPALSLRSPLLRNTRRANTAPRTVVSMSHAPLTRRQALAAAAALVAGVPLAAMAKSGDAPSISIFGVGGQSSPFTAGVQTGGKTIYKSFNDDEVAVFKRIVEESNERIEGALDSIKIKSWEDIRSRIRLEAYDLRKTQLKVNANIADAKQSTAAEKAYQTFKRDLENLDQAAVAKNQDKAYKAYNASLKSLAAWKTTVGF